EGTGRESILSRPACETPKTQLPPPAPAILFRYCRSEEAKLPHLGQQMGVVLLVAICLDHPRHEIALREAAGAVAHHALVFGKLAFEIERIFPHEGRILQHRRHATELLGRLRHWSPPGF